MAQLKTLSYRNNKKFSRLKKQEKQYVFHSKKYWVSESIIETYYMSYLFNETHKHVSY
jgi:hypothetical protein